jgi:hypothetical protein
MEYSQMISKYVKELHRVAAQLEGLLLKLTVITVKPPRSMRSWRIERLSRAISLGRGSTRRRESPFRFRWVCNYTCGRHYRRRARITEEVTLP